MDLGRWWGMQSFKEKALIALVIVVLIFGLGFWINYSYLMTAEQKVATDITIQTYTLYITGLLILFGGLYFLYKTQGTQRVRTPEEQAAYDREMAALQAKQDFSDSEEDDGDRDDYVRGGAYRTFVGGGKRGGNFDINKTGKNFFSNSKKRSWL